MERGEASRRPTASVRRRYDEERERARAERIEQLRAENPSALGFGSQDPEQPSAPDDDDGGPYDKHLLKHFDSHIARKIWDESAAPGRVLKLKYHATNLLAQWSKASLPLSVGLWVDESKFTTIADHAYEYNDAALVSAFVERWMPETNTFHMPFGEMTITLDDVLQILGVPLMGKPVYISASATWDDDNKPIDWESLMSRGLGVTKSSAPELLADTENVNLSALRQLFSGHTNNDAELRSERYRSRLFRAWMLYMFGCVVFPNKSGSKVPVQLMYFLLEPEEVKEYAWGVAILAFLYRELGKATRSKTKQMSGCLPLLLCWIFEHFPNLRRPSFDMSYTEDSPRLLRWTVWRAQGNQQESLITYRHLLDEMDPSHIIWDPYQEQRATTRPIVEENWFSGLLVCLDVMEPYYPERVLRQFGRVQNIPRNPYIVPSLESRGNGRYELAFSYLVNQLDDWRAHVIQAQARSTESRYMSQTRPGYLEWFYRVSHPRVHRGDLLFRLPMPESGIRDVHHCMDEAITHAKRTMEKIERATECRKTKRTLSKLRRIFCFACEGKADLAQRHMEEMEDKSKYF